MSVTTEIAVLSGGAMRRFMVEAVPLFERDTANKIAIRFGPTREIKAEIEASADPDRYAARTPDVVDQMPDCSRSSVARMPANTSLATRSAPRSPSVRRAGAPSWRSTQESTSRIERRSRAALCKIGAKSDVARSVQ